MPAMETQARPIQLKVEGLSLSFGGMSVLTDLSFTIRQGEIYSIIGPNGAGKTSVLNCICRFYTPKKGKIYFEGEDITHIPTHHVARKGIARTFQNIELFRGMTVLDNIKLGAHIHLKSGPLSAGIYWGKAQREEMTLRKDIEENIIDLLELEPYRKKVVGTLPYGIQKRVEMARALAIQPKLLLLDEPMAGMNLEETMDMARYILDVNKEWGITILLIEHDMKVIMDISDRVMVLNYGVKIAEGTPAEIQNNPEAIQALMGKTETSLFEI